jgi:hypothetical protein
MKLNTYTEMINGKIDFDKYINQFVTESTKKCISICDENIVSAIESQEGLNSIPLEIWDNMAFSYNKALHIKSGGNYSMSTKVCVLKAAARQIYNSIK